MSNIPTIPVKIKKLHKDAVVPTYGSTAAAGADLYAVLDAPTTIPAHKTVFVPTGLSIQMPEHMVCLIYARSGLSCKNGLAPANKVGVVDADYRGEVMVALHNHTDEDKVINNGERIAQMVFAPYYQAQFNVVDALDDTTRGSGGFGSTGNK